jgi:RNA polymerase sporulation-specific sigma factor
LYKTQGSVHSIEQGGFRVAQYNFQLPMSLQEHCKNAEEINQLISLAQKGCQESREKLTETNLKLVVNLVRRFKGKEAIYDDLFQIGTIGLIKAIDNFDLNREVRFSTYAVPMIIGEIRRYLRDTNSIKVSRNIQENTRKIRDFHEKFVTKFEREPRMSEIAENLKIDIEDVVMAIGASNEIISFSKPLSESSEDKAISLEERLCSEKNGIDDWFQKEYLKDAFKKLTEKEKRVVEMRFFQDKTQMEIGEELGISQAHVSRIEKLALLKLRKVI